MCPTAPVFSTDYYKVEDYFHIVSDCWAIRDFHENHKVTKTIEESAALALKKAVILTAAVLISTL